MINIVPNRANTRMFWVIIRLLSRKLLLEINPISPFPVMRQVFSRYESGAFPEDTSLEVVFRDSLFHGTVFWRLGYAGLVLPKDTPQGFVCANAVRHRSTVELRIEGEDVRSRLEDGRKGRVEKP